MSFLANPDKCENHRKQAASGRFFFGYFLLAKYRGVAIFAKACFGHSSPIKRQKLNATANAWRLPGFVLLLSLATQQGDRQHRCIMTLRHVVRPCIFTPQTTLRENARLLWLSGTKNLRSALATLPRFSAKESISPVGARTHIKITVALATP
jgi:hypothetical protein